MGNLILKGLGGKIARFFVWFTSSRRGPVPELEDLPLVVYSLRAEHPAPRLFAVFFSGDGGWANLTSHVASALQADGIPVVGVDCMRYFWGGKTTKDGVKADDRQENSRFGITLGWPLNNRNSLKFYGSRGVITRIGNDSDTYGVAWQYRWGD